MYLCNIVPTSFQVAKMVSKYFQDLEQREIRAEKEEALKLKKIASQMAKQVREFWSNIEKVSNNQLRIIGHYYQDQL